MTRATLISFLFLATSGVAVWGVGCGSSKDDPKADPNNPNNRRDGSVDGDTPLPDFFNEAGVDAACVNLQCKQVQCSGGKKTTVSGTVYDPAGKIPLYNVIVYVPNGEVKPFTDGITCDKCGAVTSGNPVVTALTGPDGKFTLENVPVGDDIPLVLQIGKWRRQLVIPRVDECTDTPMTDAGKMRLPRNKAEGDLPQLAIATGSIDPMECLLRKIGISDSEFTGPTEPGKVHVFQKNGARLAETGGAPNPRSPASSTLYTSTDTLKKYDIVILPCTASDKNEPDNFKSELVKYSNLGGRLFTTHYGYDWLRDAPASTAFPGTANYRSGDDGPLGTTSVTGLIDTSFPKGQDFADWLANVGASPTKGQLAINDARWNVDSTIDPTRRWIYTTTPQSTLQHLTFNTPIAEPIENQCGRVVYSNFHVVAGTTGTSERFPASCGTNMNLSPQEKALEFMLFDLSSCIQRDDERPKPPPVK